MSDFAGTLYFPVLAAHSAWRWVVLLLLTWAAFAALSGRGARRAARVAVMAADIQLALGLILYLWLSPLGSRAMAGGELAGESAFFGLIHFAAMIVALVLIHAGGISVRRGLERRGGGLFACALCLILASTPWWRPLLRI